MIARVALVLITFGLSLGALLILYEHGAPIPPTLVEATHHTKTRLFTPSEILSIDMQCPGTLYLTQEDGPPTLRIEADQALLDFIEIHILDKTLKISLKQPKNTIFNTDPPQLYLFAKDFASISASNNAHITSTTVLEIDSLDVNTRGNATIQLSIATKQLDVQSHGSNSIIITGSATDQHLELRGNTSYNALELESQKCSIYASGQFIAQIFATEHIHGSISGTGTLTFLGDPKIFVSQTDTTVLKKYEHETISYSTS